MTQPRPLIRSLLRRWWIAPSKQNESTTTAESARVFPQSTMIGFPQPTMRVKNRRYWLEADLIEWERAQLPSCGAKCPR